MSMCNFVDLSSNKLHPKVDKERAEQGGTWRNDTTETKQVMIYFFYAYAIGFWQTKQSSANKWEFFIFIFWIDGVDATTTCNFTK